jgi:DUF177 domain-containing protein
MAPLTDNFDLRSMRLAAGEGRRLELEVAIEPLLLSGEPYVCEPIDRGAGSVPVLLEVSRMVGLGYALRLRFAAALRGPCMRCLAQAAPVVEVDAREVDLPTEAGRHAPSALADLGTRAERVSPQSVPVSASGDELSSPYVHDETLELAEWARDAFALSAPLQVLCRPECAGLCPVCAVDLNEVGPEHHHEQAPDPRWAKLRELRLE